MPPSSHAPHRLTSVVPHLTPLLPSGIVSSSSSTDLSSCLALLLIRTHPSGSHLLLCDITLHDETGGVSLIKSVPV